MIIGNGMLARAFRPYFHDSESVIIFASGVSDSGNTDPMPFQREEVLLEEAVTQNPDASCFLYFGTCSVQDPDARIKPYVGHKEHMESIALSHRGGRVIRLPQAAGPNAPPNTLLASLVSRIRAEQTITVWKHATRNIIDVYDVAKIVVGLLSCMPHLPRVVNVANPESMPVLDIVRTVESVLNIKANLLIVEKGAAYQIETPEVDAIIDQTGVDFGVGYLTRVISKYYV